MSRVVPAPIVLGCCPDAPRCALCPPPPARPAPETAAALVAHYRAERAGPGNAVVASFFGGAPPDDALLAAVSGGPVHARVRPDLLSRADADRLVAAGLTALELDALTLDDAVLRGIGRRYRGALVIEIARELRGRGVRVGAVIAPGLPGSSHDQAVRDAERLAPHLDVARVHPTLVLDGSRLRDAHLDGRYTPLDLGQAITVSRAILDVLEAHGVDVIRIGAQPGPDGLGRAVAGPRHPALRQLVEARRTLERLRGLVAAALAREDGEVVVVRCAPADETRTRGPRNTHVRALRAEHALQQVVVRADPALPRGELVVHVERDRAAR